MANITSDERIEKQKTVVFNLKDKYDQAVAELDQLQKKKMEMMRRSKWRWNMC